MTFRKARVPKTVEGVYLRASCAVAGTEADLARSSRRSFALIVEPC